MPLNSTAGKYLAKLQEEFFGAAGIDPNSLSKDLSELPEDFWMNAAVAMGLNDQQMASYRQSFQMLLDEAEARRSTPYEDPSLFWLVDSLATGIEESAKEMKLVLSQRPVFGVLPLRQMNALTVRVPSSDDYVIAFQYGVFGFMNLATKAFAASLPSTEQGDRYGFKTDANDVRNHLAADSTPLRRMSDFLAAYVYAGDPHAAEQYFLPGPPQHLAEILRVGAESFVVGHEYGHIVAGHLNPDRLIPPGGTHNEIDMLPRAWQDEFEADFLGMALTAQTMARRDFDLALCYAGVDLAFTAIELAERALAVARNGDASARQTSDTHPPASMRRDMARIGLTNLTRNSDQVESARGLADALEMIGELMWERIEPFFLDMHRRGQRPSLVWGS
ncbi:MAG TPA: hypothetical protein VK781_08060 [Solirubrobacteraceae bacterium]|jgi:hypothetical protein|nr:hypothetical protein [Solirubrobacteraceae bacterium]